MKTKWKLLTLAALLSAGTTAANAAESNYVGEDAYFAETSDYVGGLYDEVAVAAPAVGDRVYGSNHADDAVYHSADVEPVAYVGDSQPSYSPQDYNTNYGRVGSGRAMSRQSQGCQSGNCGGSCGGSACQLGRRSLASRTGTWMTAEALLWFPQVRSTVPLVSANGPGLSNELDQGARIAFGGDDAFGGELQAGFRVDGGTMLSDDFGIGGRFWWLSDSEDKFNVEGTGAIGSYGIPFFDSDLLIDQENALDIIYDDGPGGRADFAGRIAARSSLSIYGAEGYGRLRLLSGKGYRSDFIGGFSHFGIDEKLAIHATAGGTDQYLFVEDIKAENKFYGGQLGFLTSVGRGAWSLTALTKVHLGNMDQTWTDNGFRQTNTTPAQPGGVFANAPQRKYNESNFAFAPEANVKLAYQLRQNVKFSVGYSFIMWDDVLMIGDNLNRNINSAYVVPDAAGDVEPAERPFFTGLKTDSFFVHGIDLGCVIQF